MRNSGLVLSVRVATTGVCGSDVPIAVEGITPTPCVPITPGHEMAGTVTAVGDAARGWVTGERVCMFLVLFDGTGSMAWSETARDSYGGPWRRCSEDSGSSPAASSR